MITDNSNNSYQEVLQAIKQLALENALKFKGKANPKALIGHILQRYPDAKKDMKKTMLLINQEIEKINSLTLDEQQDELLLLNPHYFEQQQEAKNQRKEQRSSLPELPNAIPGNVTMRIPPEPSKYNHLGHAMSFLINYLYAKKYEGKAILRFDDTNPEKSSQEFVDAVFEDIVNFLEIKPDHIKYASDNMDLYYTYAEELINKHLAYVCSCSQEDIKTKRRSGEDCPHKKQSVETNNHLWGKMKQGTLKEGSHVLRLNIDMRHKNAVMRDPIIYRLSYHPHYKTKNNYNVWPMYDFESAIEEGLCKVSHVLRSNEFDQRIELQNYIATIFNFPLVTYKHYGRYNVIGATTQGREIRALIETGEYIGWDDPRLVTIRALRRRGILKESFYELAQSIGLSKTQTNLDFSTIAAINRSILDKNAKRLFAVRKPVKIKIQNIPDSLKEFQLAYHPEQTKGTRTLAVTKEYYIEQSDHEDIPINGYVRFKDAMNLQKINETTYTFVNQTHAEFIQLSAKGPIIHFIPVSGDEQKVFVLLPDTSLQELICEPNIKYINQGEVIQFERWAFCRLDKKTSQELIFWFTHS
jgi:glutamyl-tRNA synthetase